MSSYSRREFVKMGSTIALGAIVTDRIPEGASGDCPGRLDLNADWILQSSTMVDESGGEISGLLYHPEGWYKASVPRTVLNALVKNGVYPDPRMGMNAYQIPDSSDEFNTKYDLTKFSHLPDKRNPWRDPWWFRREFTLPGLSGCRHVWLHFDSINYRADVWLNGNKVADH